MGYVAAGILFLLIASAFITYLVLTATRRSSPARARDVRAGDREDNSAPGIGADDTALGDTAEHSSSDSTRSHATEPHGTPDGRFKRDPVGGEAEGEPAIGVDTGQR